MLNTSALLIAVVLAAPGVKDRPKSDPAKIDGDWRIERYVLGGKTIEQTDETVVHIADGQIRTDGRSRVINFKLNPKSNPAQIDMMAGKSEILGIYKPETDTLTLCFPVAGKEPRPTKFESPDGSTIVLMTLKREKTK